MFNIKEELLALISGDRLVKHQYDYLKDGKPEINEVKNSRGYLHFGGYLTNLRPGAFCAEQVHGASVIRGENGKHKDQYAHAAYPMGKAAPEQNAKWQTFNCG